MTDSQETYDVIVIGAGHNGLTLALYLATAGLSVVAIDGRHEFGGGLSTEEATLPGFSHNLHSNFHGMIPYMPPYRDFELERRGVRYIHPEANIGMPLRDGRALVLYADELKTHASMARFSARDADEFRKMRFQFLDNVHELLRAAYSPPPTPEGRRALEEEFARRLDPKVLKQSALEFVLEHFESKPVQALLLYQMAICGFDPRQKDMAAAGLSYCGYMTNWQLCRGGSHHLAHALGGELLERGGDLVEASPVRRILVEGGRAAGVECADGRVYRARLAVASAIDLHQTFLEMLPADAVPAALRAKVDAIRYGPNDVIFGVHLALREPPRYAAARTCPDIDRTFNVNVGYETPEDVLEHLSEIDHEAVPARPRLNVACNTLFDKTQAPEGLHTGLIWQFAPFRPNGEPPETWDRIGADYARRCVEAWREYAPNLTDDVILGCQAYSPLDVSRKLPNMRRGGFHCAAVIMDQLGERRPLEELAHYRAPVRGLYLCGAAMHVHGGILASPGYNCAQVMAEDLGLRAKLPMLGAQPWDERSQKRGLFERIFGRR